MTNTDNQAQVKQPLAHTMQSAADAMQMSYFSVYRLIQRGELKAIRSGRIIRVPHSEILRFLGAAQ